MSTDSHYQALKHVKGSIQILRWTRSCDRHYHVALFALILAPDGTHEDGKAWFANCAVDDFGNLIRVEGA